MYGDKFDPQYLKPGILGKFFINNNLFDFESFCGFMIRMDLLYKIEGGSHILLQESPTQILSYKLDKPTTFEEIVR